MSLRVEFYLNTAGFFLRIPIGENLKNSYRTKVEAVTQTLRNFLCFALGNLLEKIFQIL